MCLQVEIRETDQFYKFCFHEFFVKVTHILVLHNIAKNFSVSFFHSSLISKRWSSAVKSTLSSFLNPDAICPFALYFCIRSPLVAIQCCKHKQSFSHGDFWTHTNNIKIKICAPKNLLYRVVQGKMVFFNVIFLVLRLGLDVISWITVLPW